MKPLTEHLTVRATLALFLIMLSASTGIIFPAHAQTDLAGALDHPALVRFPESFIIGYNRQADVTHRLVLGNLRRVGGQVVPEEAERLRGTLTRITYEAPGEFSSRDVFEFYQQQMTQKGYQRLFSCDGRSCGNSNHWANEIFNNRFLYGPEREQFYLAMRVPGQAGRETYISLYVITRANRRLLAHVEVLETAPEGAAHDEQPLTGENLSKYAYLSLDALVFDASNQLIDPAALADVVEIISDLPDASFYVVAHTRQGVDLDDMLQRSQRRAEGVVAALVELGIDGTRLIPRGVGPLAPFCNGDDCAERVDLVLQ